MPYLATALVVVDSSRRRAAWVTGVRYPPRAQHGRRRPGGGRLRSDQEIDPAVGLSEIVELGSAVRRGQPLMRIHARSEADAATAATPRSDAPD